MNAFLEIVDLFSAATLIAVSIVMLVSWSKNFRETLFYWGFGLGLWGLSIIGEALLVSKGLPATQISLFVVHHLAGLGFVFFLLYGTLILVLKKRQANIIVGTYYLAFFLATIVIGSSISNQTTLSVWHNILFITPPSLLFGVYYYYYYKKLKKKHIWFLYNLWVLFAIVAYTQTLLFSIQSTSSVLQNLWIILKSAVIISISLTYFSFLYSEKSSWNIVTKPVETIINENIKKFFEKYFYDRAESIIKNQMEKFDIKEFGTASKSQRIDFLEDTIKNYFAPIASLQKQDVIRTQLMTFLDLDIANTGWSSYSNARM